MPRQPRFSLPGQPQHVIVRGNNRSTIFHHEGDNKFFISALKQGLVKHDCALHAYVLMTKHVHLLMTPATSESIPKTMQTLGRRYVQYFNRKYGRTGTLWEGRYKAALIDSERYALTCYRYIELNPVRAHMVTNPAEYKWSSFNHNAFGRNDDLVRPHALYKRLGITPDERQSSYRALFNAHLPGAELKAIRDATNLGWACGDENFQETVANQVERPVAPSERGGDRRSKRFNRV